MRRVLLLAVLAVALGAHPAIAQNATRQAQPVRKADRAGLADAVQKHLAPADVIVLRNFDPEGDQAAWFVDFVEPNDSGFVHGTNHFEDQAKATALALPDGVTEARVTEVNVWFVFKRDGLTTQTYAIEILEGTPDAGPGEVLGREEFLLDNVNADEEVDFAEEATNHVLAEPVTVGSTFFVSVDFGSYGQADWANAALVASDLVGARVPEEWEKWSDDSWHLMSDEWFAEGDNNGWRLWVEAIVDTGTDTAVEDTDELPRLFALVQNFPNPFSASTTLQVELPARAEVELHVVDLLGRTVATLVEGPMEAGIHTMRFEAGDLPPGVYLARLRAGAATMTRKMVLVR